MDAGFFDVLHDAGDQNIITIAEGVNVDLSGVFKKAIDQHGPVLRENYRLLHITADHFFVVGDDHRAATQHIAWPHEDRETETPRDDASFLGACCSAVGR